MDIEFIKNPVEAYQQLIKENEELRIKYAGCKTANTAIQQENAELKTVYKQLKQMVKSKESLLEKAIQENSTIEYMLHLEEQENKKLKQALEEIRNIVKPCFDGDDCMKCEEDCFNKDVLKIVNEVL